jgi:hypothetical protein
MDDPQITKKGPWARFLECVQKVNAVGAAFLGLAAIVGGMWGAWFWFWPNISITSGTVASNVSPLETEYNIKTLGTSVYMTLCYRVKYQHLKYHISMCLVSWPIYPASL